MVDYQNRVSMSLVNVTFRQSRTRRSSDITLRQSSISHAESGAALQHVANGHPYSNLVDVNSRPLSQIAPRVFQDAPLLREKLGCWASVTGIGQDHVYRRDFGHSLFCLRSRHR